MKTNRLHPHSRAFTLLEVMVALALLGILVTGIYTSWYSIMKGVDVAARAAAQAQRSRMIKRTLEDSLLCACVFDQNSKYYYFVADSEGDFSTLSFVARLPDSFPRSGKFGSLNTRRVTFTVENRQLVLRQSPLLMEPDKNEMDFPLILAPDVSQFTVKFRDPKDAKSWVSEWANTNQLPREVLVQITLQDQHQFAAGGREELPPIDIALPAQNVRADWQMPIGAIPNAPKSTNAPSTNTPPVNPVGGGGGTPRQMKLGGGM